MNAKPRTPLVELALALAHMLALAGVLRALDVVVGQNPLALPLAGAIAAELIAANVGVTWSELGGKPALLGDLARAAAKGAAPIAAAVVLIVLAGRGLGLAEVDVGHPSATLFIAALRAIAIGVRDELLFRGIPLAAAKRAKLPGGVAIAFGAVAGAASLALMPSVTPAAIALELGSGLAFALLWRHGTVAAVAAHAAWALLVGAGLHGTIVEVAWSRGALAVRPHADGPPAIVALVAIVATTVGAVYLFQKRDASRADPADRPAAP